MLDMTTALLHNSLLLSSVNNLPVPQPLQFTGVGTSFSALVILAIAIDALIVALWYMAGVILNNNSVKGSARSELNQVIGTALIAGLIMATLIGFGLLYQNVLAGANGGTGGTVLSPLTMFRLCSHLGYSYTGGPGATGAPNLSIIDTAIASQFTYNGGNPTLQNNAPSFCDIVTTELYAQNNPGLAGDGTVYVEYPLAASAVVLANLTSQTADDLNQTFVLDAYITFLKGFQTTLGFCLQDPDIGSCAAAPIFGAPPIPGAPAPLLYLKWAQTPLAGLDMIRQSLPTLSNLLYLALGSFIGQLIFINILMYIWPFLIFFGLALRGIFFLRKIGGLLIAIAIGAILFYPTVFGIEYLGASNSSITSPQIANQPLASVGFQPNPGTLAFCSQNSPYQYNINFYDMPSVQGIAQDCHCWPSFGLLGSELADVALFNEPFVWIEAGGDTFANWFTKTLSGASSGLGAGCNSQASCAANSLLPNLAGIMEQDGLPSCAIGGYAPTSTGGINYGNGGEGMIFGLSQAYGVIGVTAYFLPILNILLTLAAIRGLSGLMGGDVDLAGLSRFV